jgi:hypothetical protein
LNLLIENRTDILINQQILVQILSKIDGRDKDDIYENIDKERDGMRKQIVDGLPKLLIPPNKK